MTVEQSPHHIGRELHQLPNSIKEIFFDQEQPRDRKYVAALAASVAVLTGAAIVGISNSQAPSLIRNLISLIERIQ